MKYNTRKCEACRENAEKGKYITILECRPSGEVGKRYGMFYVQVGPNYIGKKFRIIVEEV